MSVEKYRRMQAIISLQEAGRDESAVLHAEKGGLNISGLGPFEGLISVVIGVFILHLAHEPRPYAKPPPLRLM